MVSRKNRSEVNSKSHYLALEFEAALNLIVKNKILNEKPLVLDLHVTWNESTNSFECKSLND